MFKNVTKADLITVLCEIGETADLTFTVCELKDKLLKSQEYLKDKDFITEFLATTVLQRKNEEELNRLRLQHESEKSEFVNSSSNVDQNISIDKLLKAVQTLSIPVPKTNETWNLFFDSVERAFKHKNVPSEFKSEILLKLIGEKASNILVYINDDDLEDYDKIKSLIVKEYEPSPMVCLDNFKEAKRFSGETHQQFASRLRSTFLHYCKIRKVNDFDSLINLIISDKIFETLDPEVSTHIAVRQGEQWFSPKELSQECDIYFNAKGFSFDETKNKIKSSYSEPPYENSIKYIPPQKRETHFSSENKGILKTRECYICSSNSHLAKFCPKKKNKYDSYLSKDKEIKLSNHSQEKVNKPNDDVIVSRVNSIRLKSAEKLCEINLYPLQRIPIYIGEKCVESIIDSGLEISVLNTSVMPDIKCESKGKIILESPFKEKIEANLVLLPVSYKNPNDCIFSTANIIFALTDKLNVPCLITPDVYNSLLKPQADEKTLDLQVPCKEKGGKRTSDFISSSETLINENKKSDSNIYLVSKRDNFFEANQFRKMQTECNNSENLSENLVISSDSAHLSELNKNTNNEEIQNVKLQLSNMREEYESNKEEISYLKMKLSEMELKFNSKCEELSGLLEKKNKIQNVEKLSSNEELVNLKEKLLEVLKENRSLKMLLTKSQETPRDKNCLSEIFPVKLQNIKNCENSELLSHVVPSSEKVLVNVKREENDDLSHSKQVDTIIKNSKIARKIKAKMKNKKH